MKVLVKVYDGDKYDPMSKKVSETRYNNVVSLDVKDINDG